MKLTFEALAKGVLFAGVTLSLTACPPKPKSTPVEPPPEDTQAQVPEGDADTAPAIEFGTEYVTVPGLGPVYFETNSANLSQEGRETLKKNATLVKAILQEAAGAQIRLEGHADERGTLEYNLALGQRRANAVRDYYASLGLKKSTLATISYGEERQVCTDGNENCWWRNRRGETTLKSGSGMVRIPMDKLPQP